MHDLSTATAENFGDIVSQRMSAEAMGLSSRWFSSLQALLLVDANEVFPSEKILDHIPALIEAIARYLRAPADEEIAANTDVIEKARELGVLRHAQQASVHQILREFEILGEILESFAVAEAARLPEPRAAECLETVRRITRSIRTLMRTTVDTFIAEYTATIQERNDRLKLFNRMASHELRTPLGTLLFAAAALDQPSVRADGDRLGKVAVAIRSNTQRLTRLVENLAGIARLTEPQDGPHLQKVDIRVIGTEVARQLEDMAAARGVSIVVDDQLPQIVVDPARLELVLMNLVSNAIKYSDAGKSEPFVEIVSMPAERADRVTIAVRDNGLGVPDELQSAIFERFTRVHAHLDNELGVSGSGLGLAIVAECVEAVGATIACRSAVGEGTTFVISLPIEPVAAPPVPPAG